MKESFWQKNYGNMINTIFLLIAIGGMIFGFYQKLNSRFDKIEKDILIQKIYLYQHIYNKFPDNFNNILSENYGK